MAQQFNAADLIAEARRTTGLERFDSESFREGLDVLLADASQVDYPEQGAQRFRATMVAALANRLQATAYLDQHPELLQRPIERPVFVFGVPRTGTTLLSNLLAADPARRSPLTWEIDDPVPPPSTATLYNDPRALARLEMERKMLAARPEMGKYYRNSAIYPNECMFFINSDFKALMWESRGRLPNYRDYLFGNDIDLTSTYRYHKRFLQLLQADAPGIWNLKMPSHALYLDTLLEVYPDARLVWTHRVRSRRRARSAACCRWRTWDSSARSIPNGWARTVRIRPSNTPAASWIRAHASVTTASSTCTTPT